ncbi:hypothetical protein GCM10011581_40200 [Saccharopolyspora subtropica]|uniref:Uncharacterized protein n=1 Tax=Saccharopolyspora thermophila TaxID=89367 RepID=A0A917NHP8_9PSEU|nr:hypothetical protein [Saccharopolyspora subtropica]GGI98945.1 hypothetical protein GCM10011581_40200 [Saccharopolyspora subtropica]
MPSHVLIHTTNNTDVVKRGTTPHLEWLRERWPDLTASLAELLRADGRPVPPAWKSA